MNCNIWVNRIYKLSIPSVIFADANWYGSLRGGVEFGGGNDAAFKDGGSRWGIKGSNEVSEGLSAVYRFEHKISTENAGQPGGRLAYVGLSGGFGTVSLGQIWNAGYNHVGSITDPSWHYGNSHTGYRHGSALSYSVSAGAVSLQLDAIMDGGVDSGDAVDKLEFGMTFGLGDIGKVALAYIDKKDHMMQGADVFMAGTPTTVEVTPGTAGTAPVVTVTPGEAGTPPTVEVTPGTAGTPTMVDVTDATPGSPESQATFQYFFTVGSQQVNIGDPIDGSGDEAETPPSEGVPTSASQAFLNAFNSHYGIFRPTGKTEGVTATFNIVNDQGETTPVSVFVPMSSLSADGTSITTAIPYGDDQTIPADGSVMIPEELTNTRVAFEDRSSTTIENRQVSDYQEATDGTPIMVEVTDGTAGTPTVVEVTPGTEGTAPTVTVTPGEAGTPPTVEVTPGTAGKFVTPDPEVVKGHRASFIATQVNLGAVSAHLGYLQKQMNGADAKTKVTHYGVSGSLGDTGMSFLVQARKEDMANGTERTPWLANITKGLGGGTTAYVEHGNADDGNSGTTRFGLKVDF